MKRLFIDLEACYKCKECKVPCDYLYHPENQGQLTLIEKAIRSIVCRKCELAPCVEACSEDALEKLQDGNLKRYSFRCITCRNCEITCPFGVNIDEITGYKNSVCDYCLERLKKDMAPICTTGCPENAIQYKEIKEDISKDIYQIDEHLVVHAFPWKDADVRR